MQTLPSTNLFLEGAEDREAGNSMEEIPELGGRSGGGAQVKGGQRYKLLVIR